MAYDTSNPPRACYDRGLSGGGRGEWEYLSTHTQAEVAGTGFFTNGMDLRIRLGDRMFVTGSTTYVLSSHAVNAVSSTGVTVSAGLCISSAS